MNKNTKARANEIRDLTRAAAPSFGNSKTPFLDAQAQVIADGSSREPVTMQFTAKWESNSAYRFRRL